MYTISQLAKRFGLSRSTLLYYDSIGVLSPSGRSSSGYRLYRENEAERLEKICLYRQTGVSLKEIRRLLTPGQSEKAQILERRLLDLNREISELRRQQAVIVNLLQNQLLRKATRVLDKAMWVKMLAAAGLDEEGMLEWHRAFEADAPEAHQDFLESLGLAPPEIKRIRARSRRSRQRR